MATQSPRQLTTCIGCGAIRLDLLSCEGTGTRICPRCASNLAGLILDAGESLRAQLWRVPVTAFGRAGVRPPSDQSAAETHSDLAQAYRVMGLHADAIFEAVTCILGPCSPAAAERSLAVLFDPGIAQPGALQILVDRLRRRDS